MQKERKVGMYIHLSFDDPEQKERFMREVAALVDVSKSTFDPEKDMVVPEWFFENCIRRNFLHRGETAQQGFPIVWQIIQGEKP